LWALDDDSSSFVIVSRHLRSSLAPILTQIPPPPPRKDHPNPLFLSRNLSFSRPLLRREEFPAWWDAPYPGAVLFRPIFSFSIFHRSSQQWGFGGGVARKVSPDLLSSIFASHETATDTTPFFRGFSASGRSFHSFDILPGGIFSDFFHGRLCVLQILFLKSPQLSYGPHPPSPSDRSRRPHLTP